MSRALKTGLEQVRAWVLKSDSRVQSIVSGQGTAGTRAGNNDKKIGVRLDNSDTFTGIDGKQYKRYKFQANRDADDKTLKGLADKDSHKFYATADIPIVPKDKPLKKAEARALLTNLFAELEKKIKT
jgi:hypothetical protein